MATVMSTCPPPTNRRRVVIAGGGYAGTTLAVNLGKALKRDPSLEFDVLLVEPNPCQQALSELDLVAVGPVRPEFCELWHTQVFRGLPVSMCYNRVSDVRPKESKLCVGDGEPVPYWRLVLATGAIAFVPPVPGLKEHAVTMWSVDDAQELQRRIQDAFREAARTRDAEKRRHLLSFTVIGGGATGIEIIGTLGQLLPKRAHEAGVDPSEMHISLVEGRPDILYDLTPDLRKKTIRRLQAMGVEVILGSMVDRVEDGFVHLANGREVPSNVLCFAGGAKADPHAIEWGLETTSDGRVVADPVLKTTGYPDIYAVGDVSAARDPKTNRTLPMLAQYAIRQAEHTAENIIREAKGQELQPFVPHMHGEFVSVGPRWGVGWAFKARLTGVPAILMKRMTYVMYWFQVGGARLAWNRTREMASMQR